MTKTNESRALTADEILEQSDCTEVRRVEVPEWGGHVYVRMITATERDQWEQKFVGRETGDRNLRGSFVWLCLCDAGGKPLYLEKPYLANGFAKKSARVINRIFEAAHDLNGMGEKSIEELEKNSETIPGDDSPSNSPDTSDAPSES